MLRITELLHASHSSPSVAYAASSLQQLPPKAWQDVVCIHPPSLSTCATALGLHFAGSCIQRHGGQALVLCLSHTLEDCGQLLLPAAADGGTLDQLLSRIQIKYISSASELLQFCAALHLLAQPPASMIVLGLSKLLAGAGRQLQPRGQDVQLVHALGLLSEGIRVLRSTTGSSIPLLVTDEASDASGKTSKLFILQRWLPLCIHLRPPGSSLMADVRVDRAEPSSFTLSLHARGTLPLPHSLQTCVLHYTAQGSQFQLEAVTFDNDALAKDTAPVSGHEPRNYRMQE